MSKQKTIVSMQSYGRVKLKLGEKMDEMGITRNSLARGINARFEVADKWYRGDVEKLDLDILARICFVLNCEVKDILEYEKAEN